MSKQLVRLAVPLALVFCLAAFAGTASAEKTMAVKAGKWEMKSKSSMPMMGAQPARIECVTRDEISPEQLLADSPDCTASDVVTTSNSMSWKMTCKPKGSPPVSGSGAFSTTGDTMKGELTMSLDFGGKPMNIVIDMEGKRLGDCD